MDEATTRKIIKKARISDKDITDTEAHSLLKRILERLYKLRLIKYFRK